MLYMVIETFRGGNPIPVYRRFQERGRLMPEGIEYQGSIPLAECCIHPWMRLEASSR
jgi:hypothetical protein